MNRFVNVAMIWLLALSLSVSKLSAQNVPFRPNIVVLFSDDISARELPLYGSSVWSKPTGGDTSDAKFRASTPVLDRLAEEGCWVKTAWASAVCSASLVMMMTGRYAHLHKWWGNKSKGTSRDENGKEVTWPLDGSSPRSQRTSGQFVSACLRWRLRRPGDSWRWPHDCSRDRT